jgi:hypothetical protein
MKTYYRLFKLALYLTALSGIGYFIIHEWFKMETEYGPRPHPWQEHFQHFHLLFSPWLVLMTGALIPSHIMLKLKQDKRKRTGIVMVCLFVLMVLSGPLLQFGFEGLVEDVIEWVHILSASIFLILFMVHVKLKLS